MKATKLVLWSMLAMALSASAETVDPAAFGLSPDAEPSVNVVAMRKALSGGKRTVKIAKRGVYRVDDTIFLDDDTVLECVSGVVFQRTILRAAHATS